MPPLPDVIQHSFQFDTDLSAITCCPGADRVGVVANCQLCGARACGSTDPGSVPAPMPAFEVRFREGQLLYMAGQRGDAVFLLRRGLVKETLAAEGCERVVRLVGGGGATGLAAMLREPHRHSATVIGPGIGCRIPAHLLQRALSGQPAAAFSLLLKWQGALDDADRVIGEFSSGPARARLARFVLYLASSLGRGARLRRRETAELIGVTPVSVTRLIGEFKREGLIEERASQLARWDEDRLRSLGYGHAPTRAAARHRCSA